MSESAPAPAPARPAPRRGGVAGWVVLLLLVLAAWLGWRAWTTHVDARAARDGEQARLAALESRLDALRRDQRANAERLLQATTTNRLLREELLGLGQRASLLEDTVADLAERGGGDLRLLRMDEADLLLSTAAQRLLAGDAAGAGRAYALAGTALSRLDGPEALDLRQALAQERAALEALGPDPAIAARERLDALERALPKLPERASRGPAAPASWWRRLAARVVDVRPTAGAAVVAPAERAGGVAALRLEVALARAALERRDRKAFADAIDRIDGWLARLWPASAPRDALRRNLRDLRGRPVRLQAPELGSTLAQLRRLRDDG